MNYISNNNIDNIIKEINQVSGFNVNKKIIYDAIINTNRVLKNDIPYIVYRVCDFKAKSGIISALMCSSIEKASNRNGIVNPIEKGHPDIIPKNAQKLNSYTLMHYNEGIEMKCTSGSLKRGFKSKNGKERINELGSITWQAHHNFNTSLMTIIWDYYNNNNYPTITGVFFSNELLPSDWGKISGKSGYNTKVTSLKASGKNKLKNGWLMIIDTYYKKRYLKLLTPGR